MVGTRHGGWLRSWRIRDLPFVQDATTGRRVTRWWLSYVLTLLVFILGIPGIVGAVFLQTWVVERGTVEAQLQEALTFASGFVGLALWVLLRERRSIASLGFRRPGRGVLVMLAGVVLGIALNTLPTLFLLAVGSYAVTDAPAGSTSGAAALPLLLVIVLFVLVQSGTEEALTRGFMLQSSGVALPGWAAVLLPAVIFTLFHGVSTRPLAFGTILLFALLVTFIVLRQGALWLAIGIHTGWNFAMGNVFGLSVSGLPAYDTSWVFVERTDGAPEWLTGGDFGTEAGVPALLTLAMAAAVAFVLFRRWERGRVREVAVAPLA